MSDMNVELVELEAPQQGVVMDMEGEQPVVHAVRIEFIERIAENVELVAEEEPVAVERQVIEPIRDLDRLEGRDCFEICLFDCGICGTYTMDDIDTCRYRRSYVMACECIPDMGRHCCAERYVSYCKSGCLICYPVTCFVGVVVGCVFCWM
jgi:hypothetical protein